jgi:hypothetical protein
MLFLHPETGSPVDNELIYFVEAARIKEQPQSLTGGEFAFLMLGVNAPLPTALVSLFPHCFQPLQPRVTCHQLNLSFLLLVT